MKINNRLQKWLTYFFLVFNAVIFAWGVNLYLENQILTQIIEEQTSLKQKNEVEQVVDEIKHYQKTGELPKTQ